MIDGTAATGDGFQDVILLVALGVSVMIGVFASQLAGETWESVTEEIEAEKLKKKETVQSDDEGEDDSTRSLFGFDLPLWAVGAQIALKEAELRVEEMILLEYQAAVWNCTDDNPPEDAKNPSNFDDSPEILGVGNGFDVVASLCDGFVLSPSLAKAYFKYADPLHDQSKDLEIGLGEKNDSKDLDIKVSREMQYRNDNNTEWFDKRDSSEAVQILINEDYLLTSLQILREEVAAKLIRIEKEFDKLLL